MKNKIKGIALIFLSMVGMTVTYTNCTVRRISMLPDEKLIKQNLSSSNNNSTSTNNPTSSKICFKHKDFSYSPLTGIVNAPPLRSTHSEVADTGTGHGTTISFDATSDCISAQDFTEGTCSPKDKCQPSKRLVMQIRAVCNSEVSGVTSCDNLTDKYDKNLDISQTDTDALFTEFWVNEVDITCDENGDEVATTLNQFKLPVNGEGTGSIMFQEIGGDLSEGQSFKMLMKDIVLKSTESDETISLSGTYAAAITKKTCTPSEAPPAEAPPAEAPPAEEPPAEEPPAEEPPAEEPPAE